MTSPTAAPGAPIAPATVATVPLGAPWHIWWAGLTLGWPTTAWTLSDLSGWLTLTDSQAANTERQARWGSFAGLQTFGLRTIEASFTYTAYGDAEVLRPIRQALTPQEDPVEQPLWIWAGTRRPEMVMARVDKASIPSDLDFSLGYHRITVSWVATDPVRYGEQGRGECGLPVPADTGLLFASPHAPDGLDFIPRTGTDVGLEFGTGTGGGVMAINNDGLLNVWPVLQVIGPVTAPAIAHVESGQTIAFSSECVLTAGAVMEIDTNNRYASQSGVTRAHLMTSRDWFALPPGYSRLRFTAAANNTSARLIALWRTAAII
jgi:hypothetical protein